MAATASEMRNSLEYSVVVLTDYDEKQPDSSNPDQCLATC